MTLPSTDEIIQLRIFVEGTRFDYFDNAVHWFKRFGDEDEIKALMKDRPIAERISWRGN